MFIAGKRKFYSAAFAKVYLLADFDPECAILFCFFIIVVCLSLDETAGFEVFDDVGFYCLHYPIGSDAGFLKICCLSASIVNLPY